MSEHNPDESRARDQAGADDSFAASVAGPLRAPESLDPTFEQRLMSAVQAEVRARESATSSRSWWRNGRTLTLSPLNILAAAAGIVGIFAAGVAAASFARDNAPATRLAVARQDSVQMVRFVFVDSTARSVALVGDFNGWTKGVTPLSPGGRKGAWVVSVPLALGRHEYAFIVDGTRWVADPFAIPLHDEFGTESSVVTLTKQG